MDLTKSAKNKFQINRQPFAATGTIGGAGTTYDVRGHLLLRLAIEGVGGGNSINVYGRIMHQTNWTLLDTIAGTTDGTSVDISLYDEVYFDCTTFSASGSPVLIASGFQEVTSGGGGSVISGSGAANQITYWTGASSVSGSDDFQYDDATKTFTFGQELTLTKNASDDYRWKINGTDMLWLSTAQVEIGSHVRPRNDGNQELGSGAKRWQNLYLSSYLSVGNDSPGSSVVYIGAHDPHPKIILKDQSGSQCEIRGFDSDYVQFSTPISVPVGSNTNVSVNFADLDTGWYSSNPARVDLSLGGVNVLTFDAVTTAFSFQLGSTAGSVSAPPYSSATDTNTGMYFISGDVLGWATGGVIAGKADGGNWTLGRATMPVSSQHTMNAEFMVQSGSIAAAPVQYLVENTDNTNGASAAKFIAITGGASGGDPYHQFTISGQVDWAHGVDNSDNDNYKISLANTLGTNDRMVISSTLGTMILTPGTGADVIALDLRAGTVGGTVRNYWRNSNSTKGFEFDADFTNDYLLIQSDTTTAGRITRAGRLQWLDGTAALPAIGWTADPTTGWYRTGSGVTSYSAVTNEVLRMGPTAINAFVGVSVGVLTTDPQSLSGGGTLTGATANINASQSGAGAAANLVVQGGGTGNQGANIYMQDGNSDATYRGVHFRKVGNSFEMANYNEAGPTDQYTFLSVALGSSGGQVAIGRSSTTVNRFNNSTATTVGAAGAASALPVLPTGYLTFNINGTDQKVPYYAV